MQKAARSGKGLFTDSNSIPMQSAPNDNLQPLVAPRTSATSCFRHSRHRLGANPIMTLYERHAYTYMQQSIMKKLNGRLISNTQILIHQDRPSTILNANFTLANCRSTNLLCSKDLLHIHLFCESTSYSLHRTRPKVKTYTPRTQRLHQIDRRRAYWLRRPQGNLRSYH